MIRRTADVQKENGNGILKTRGRFDPRRGHGGRPRGRDGRDHAGRPRTNLGNSSGSFTCLGMTTTYHQSRPAGDDASESDGTLKSWTLQRYHFCLLMGVIRPCMVQLCSKHLNLLFNFGTLPCIRLYAGRIPRWRLACARRDGYRRCTRRSGCSASGAIYLLLQLQTRARQYGWPPLL